MAEISLALDLEHLVDSLRRRVGVDFAEDRTGHDLAHLDRVYGLSKQLRDEEGGDPAVIAAACYVHDYHRVFERLAMECGPSITQTVDEDFIASVLADVGFPPNLVPQVFGCVEFTDKYSFSGHCLDSPSVEACILRDADNLDAIGAIGIARAFMFGGALGEPIWVEGTDPAQVYDAGATTSVVHHFHEKLLRIRDDMSTRAGRALADQRHDFMLAFLDRLSGEWKSAGLGTHSALGFA